MSIERIKWVNGRIHVRKQLEEIDEDYHETDIYYPSEALEMLIWLLQEQPTLLAAYKEEVQRKEQV